MNKHSIYKDSTYSVTTPIKRFCCKYHWTQQNLSIARVGHSSHHTEPPASKTASGTDKLIGWTFCKHNFPIMPARKHNRVKAWFHYDEWTEGSNLYNSLLAWLWGSHSYITATLNSVTFITSVHIDYFVIPVSRAKILRDFTKNIHFFSARSL